MSEFIKITEQVGYHRHLEKKSIAEILQLINEEDKKVAFAIEKSLHQIQKLVEAVTDKMLSGGRLFYIGAGTSGRIGVLDASEWCPTFGVPLGLVRGVIAGGQTAITTAVEFAEDDFSTGWNDLEKYAISYRDIVIGLSASGTTPYVLGALDECKKRKIITGSVTCNPSAPISSMTNFPIEVIVGPEFITGSTRMKAATAQKLVLNMISTAVMVQLGRIEDNSMINMQLTNEKLIDRGVKMLMALSNEQNYEKAKELLLKWGSVKQAINASQNKDW